MVATAQMHVQAQRAGVTARQNARASALLAAPVTRYVPCASTFP